MIINRNRFIYIRIVFILQRNLDATILQDLKHGECIYQLSP